VRPWGAQPAALIYRSSWGNDVTIDLKTTITIVEQVKALVRAIESLDVIESNSPWERQVAQLLRAAYKRKLQDIAETAPASISEEILSACGDIDDERLETRLREH
jgi:hypothetical protein